MRLILFLLIISITRVTFSQDRQTSYDYRIKEVTLPGGQSANSVTDIVEDKEGFLWFGGQGGVFRYDGYEFVRYDQMQNDSITSTIKSVECLLWDDFDKLWVGTFGNGIYRFDPLTEVFEHFTFEPDNPNSLSNPTVSCIVKDGVGDIWIGTQKGLNRFDHNTQQFERFYADSTDKTSISHDYILDAHVDRQGVLWVGTGKFAGQYDSGSLNRYHPTTRSFSRQGYISKTPNRFLDIGIRTIMEDREQNLWLGTADGLQKLNKVNNRIETTQYHPDQIYAPGAIDHRIQTVKSILEDSQGGLWIGTIYDVNYRSHLLRYDPATQKTQHFPQVNDIWQLFESSDGIIWVASGSGGNVYRITPKTKGYDLQVENEFLAAFLEQKIISNADDFIGPYHFTSDTVKSALWAGCFNKFTHQPYLVANYPDQQRTEIYPLNGLIEDRGDTLQRSRFPAHGMAIDNQGNIWGTLETDAVGLFCFNPETGNTRHYQHNPSVDQSLSSNRISDILVDSRGVIWTATYGGGLNRFDVNTNQWTHYNSDKNGEHKIDGSFPQTLAEDEEGVIWIGGSKGVHPDERKKQHDMPFLNGIHLIGLEIIEVDMPDTLINTAIQNLLFAGNGWFQFSLWDKGKGSFNTAFNSLGYLHNTGNNYFPYDNIGVMLQDKQGIGWTSSTSDARFTLQKGDGALQVLKNNSQIPSSARDGAVGPNGHVYVANEKGYVEIDPNIVLFDVQKDTNALQLVDLYVSGEKQRPAKSTYLPQPIWLMQQLELTHTATTFAFRFSDFNFQKNNTHFQYRLYPYETNWQKTRGIPYANYSKVAAGTYQFQVKILYENGEDSKPMINLKVVVLPPWWKTWWAYMLYFSGVTGFLYWLYNFQLSRKLAIEKSKRLEEITQLKTNLYTNITHEFRTPLTVILGMADDLKSKTTQIGRHDFFQPIFLIQRNGENLLKLVNRMLDLAKLDSGHLKLELQQGDIISFIKYLGESFQSLATERKINLKVNSSIEQLVMDFDKDKIATIISNILSNALKFTPANGHVNVYLQQKQDAKQSFFIIKIIDNGEGIAETELPYIFDRFYQADNRMLHHYEGTGIGLALTKELITLMEGSIEVKSKIEEGSQFMVKLPISNQANFVENMSDTPIISSNKATDLVINQNETAGELPIILIVEDNQDVAFYIKSCLREKYQILYAKDGQEGIEMALEHIPDLIISDVMMPHKDGFEVCQTLKTDERTNHIPIVMLTAKATVEDRLTGLQHGADAYLAKPFQREELLIRLKKLLELRRLLQQKYSTQIVSATTPPTPAVEDAFVKKAKAIVLEHLADENFSSSQLEQQLHLSRSQVYRKIKAVTGFSTAIFIRRIRLQEACQLLQSSDLSISEIAYQVGFKSPVYFSQVFKETFQQSPTELRN